MSLTIAIPTYNRLNQLRITVQALLAQLCEEISILIIDDASKTPVTHQGLLVDSFYSERIKIVRNRFNVGLSANLVRCLEICETKFIWILGDDDLPSENSIETIKSALHTFPDAISYNFQYQTARKHVTVSHGMNDFIRAMGSYGETIFISSNVYNCWELQKYLYTGYDFTYSYAPHLAILLNFLRINGGEVFFSSKRIVKGNQPACDNPWSAVSLIMRKYSILDIPMDPDIRLLLGRKIAKFAGNLNSVFVYFVYESCNAKNKHYKDMFEDIVNRSFRYLTFQSKFKVLLFKVLLNYPRLSYAILNFIVPQRQLLPIINRENMASPNTSMFNKNHQ